MANAVVTYFAILGVISHVWMGVAVAADWDYGLTQAERFALYASCIVGALPIFAFAALALGLREAAASTGKILRGRT